MSVQWAIRAYDCLPSTQDEAHALAAAGAAEGFWVEAAAQEAGRGRHGRGWESQAGNLYASFVLKPDCDAAQVGTLSLLIGVALAQALARFVDPALISLKWPNDVLLSGRKVAGILLETELARGGGLAYVIAGMGVNVAHAPLAESTCAVEFSVGGVSVEAVRGAFMEVFPALYAQWQSGGFGAVRGLWLEKAHKVGASVQVKAADRVYSGVFEGLAESGALLLREENGTIREVSAGELVF